MYFKAFALTGRLVCAIRLPRALPWAKSFCPFRACCQKLASALSFALPFGLRISIPFGWLPLVQGDNLAEYFVLTEQKRS